MRHRRASPATCAAWAAVATGYTPGWLTASSPEARNQRATPRAEDVHAVTIRRSSSRAGVLGVVPQQLQPSRTVAAKVPARDSAPVLATAQRVHAAAPARPRASPRACSSTLDGWSAPSHQSRRQRAGHGQDGLCVSEPGTMHGATAEVGPCDPVRLPSALRWRAAGREIRPSRACPVPSCTPGPPPWASGIRRGGGSWLGMASRSRIPHKPRST